MCLNHKILHKLREEIAAANIADGIISDDKAKSLPYLQAVIKEGFRIFPPIAALMSKEVPPQGDTWNNVFIPGGTRVGYSIWAITRREDIWGEDALEFRPERWLEGPAEKIKEMESTADLIFSYGRWLCLGKSIALIELNKVFVEVRCFVFGFVFFESPRKPANSLFFFLCNSSSDDSTLRFAIPPSPGKSSTTASFLNRNCGWMLSERR
jgi:hypothetical protein